MVKLSIIKKVIDEETREIKIINKDTGEEIKDIEVKKDSITGKEIISIQKEENQKKNNINIIIIKDPKSGKEVLIDKETGEKYDNIEKKKEQNIISSFICYYFLFWYFTSYYYKLL